MIRPVSTADAEGEKSGSKEEELTKPSAGSILSEHGKAYCETTSIHGFAYWVSAPRVIEKAFWVIVVITFMCCAAAIIHAAAVGWISDPSATKIKTFSKAVTSVAFPSITLCNPAYVDTGEYLRATLDNLEYDGVMQAAFADFLRTPMRTPTREVDGGQVAQETSKFLVQWAT